ncbi:MAG: tripartite tricarboxylate transporter substrate binding protein [Hyphomicrobiales bacterium]|nr:tripartite tricarboxylate transporter substrate binding protein [Hyphomicrobiales bacterium]
MRTILQRALAILVLALPPLAGAAAQDFPSWPVRFVVPYAAGGSGDVLARLIGDKLAALWGQQVVVDNKPGAGGLIGTEFAARSEPDGHTIYLATDGPLTIAATLHKHVPYDWKRDFAPVSMIAVGYQIMLASPKLPAGNLKEFIALAQKEPGKLNYASIGIGSAPHLGAEMFMSLAKVRLTHVPYRGSSAQAITALITGDVAMFFVGTSTAVPHVKAATVRGLAVTSPSRLDGLREVPTFAELDLPGVDNSLWFAVLAPSRTPPTIVRKLHDDIAKVVADPDYRGTLAARGFEARSSTPEQLAAFLEKDYLKSRDLITRLGLKVE